MNHTNDAPTNENTTEPMEATEEKMENQSVDTKPLDEVDAKLDETAVEENELERLTKLADENYQRFLRVQADFDNFRRRSRQEKEEFAKYASMKLLEQLLPVVDNFERALAAGKESNENDALLKGVEMIFRLMNQVLEQEGLKPIEAVGQPFNPEYHQAIMQVDSEEHDEGIVVEEIQKGYLLKDKVLRPSMVKVSS